MYRRIARVGVKRKTKSWHKHKYASRSLIRNSISEEIGAENCLILNKTS